MVIIAALTVSPACDSEDAGGEPTADDAGGTDAGAGESGPLEADGDDAADGGDDGADGAVDDAVDEADDGADTGSADDSADDSGPSTDDGGAETGSGPLDVEECMALAEAVVFDNTPPPGETRVPGLGECVTLLPAQVLWDYHCQWCHSTIDDNDIQDRSLEKVWWAVDLSESLGNWPVGGLADYPEQVEAIQAFIEASPEATVDAHPHPLPQYE